MKNSDASMSLKKKQKLESRKRLLEASGRLFRKGGFSATGIDAVVEEAGLTAGAFYAHFESKENLLKCSLEQVFESSAGRWMESLQGLAGEELIRKMLAIYVNQRHRDLVDSGCAIPSLAAELTRSSGPIREVAEKYIRKWIQLFQANLGGEAAGVENEAEPMAAAARRARAIQLVAQAVGAILLSRIVVSQSLSDEILKAGREP